MSPVRRARPRRTFSAALALSLLSLAASCGDDGGSDSAGGASGAPSALERDVVAQYVRVVRASYADSIAGARDLHDAVQALVADPTEGALDDAREAWIAARPAYLQTEAYRFYEGPIDNEADGPEGYINGWPLDEAFIDYTETQPGSGIINQVEKFPDITREVLVEENENGGEDYLSTGYHAIEFLLWGQDLSETGPGDRPYTDYVVSQDGPGLTAERRGVYIDTAAALLVAQLEDVARAWEGGADYGDSFLADEGRQSLRAMLRGIEELTGKELSGERMDAAIRSGDQEDEHSCFSDNTHADYVFDAEGIENVYLGRYGDDDGPGIDELVKAKDAELDGEMKDALAAMKTAIANIPAPVDQALATKPGRDKIMAASAAVLMVHDVIVKITSALEL